MRHALTQYMTAGAEGAEEFHGLAVVVRDPVVHHLARGLVGEPVARAAGVLFVPRRGGLVREFLAPARGVAVVRKMLGGNALDKRVVDVELVEVGDEGV